MKHEVCVFKLYKFIASLIIWHDLLNSTRINPIRKHLKDKVMDTAFVLKSFGNLKTFTLEYRSY